LTSIKESQIYEQESCLNKSKRSKGIWATKKGKYLSSQQNYVFNYLCGWLCL